MHMRGSGVIVSLYICCTSVRVCICFFLENRDLRLPSILSCILYTITATAAHVTLHTHTHYLIASCRQIVHSQTHTHTHSYRVRTINNDVCPTCPIGPCGIDGHVP